MDWLTVTTTCVELTARLGSGGFQPVEVMPGQNGFQLTRAITRDPRWTAVPVIMCTSKNQETDKVWGMRQGARDYIVKPVNGDELIAKIRAFD